MNQKVNRKMLHDVNEQLADFANLSKHFILHKETDLFYSNAVEELIAYYDCMWLIKDILQQTKVNVLLKSKYEITWMLMREMALGRDNEVITRKDNFILTASDNLGNFLYAEDYEEIEFDGDILRLYFNDNDLGLFSKV